MADDAGDLRALLSPKTGLQRIPMPLESYEHASLPLSAKRLLNLYAEKQPGDARSPFALVPSPGLVRYNDIGSGPILAMSAELPGRLYVVSGTQLFRLRTPGDWELMGDVGSPSDATKIVTIAQGPTACVVCVPPRAYACGQSEPLAQIGGDFPGGNSVCYIDGYFVFTSAENSSQFFVSNLLDATSYDALDFAFSDAVPNVVRRCITHRGEVWMMGEAGIEIWYDAGAPDFPLRRQSGGVIEIGVASPRSVARADNSVFWVGADGIVYRSVGYQAKRISTHAIEQIVAAYGAGSVTAAFSYSQMGHIFYAITYGNRTLVYDCLMQCWHERSSSPDGSGPWRVQCAAPGGISPILGDSYSGRMFLPDLSRDYDEGGSRLLRLLTAPPIWANTRRAFMARLEVEMEVGNGTAPDTVRLEWSDDGGFFYNGSRTIVAPRPGSRLGRIAATRLGSFEQRVLRLSMTGQATIYGIDADTTLGNS